MSLLFCPIVCGCDVPVGIRMIIVVRVEDTGIGQIDMSTTIEFIFSACPYIMCYSFSVNVIVLTDIIYIIF